MTQLEPSLHEDVANDRGGAPPMQSRRRFVRASFFGLLGLGAIGFVTAVADYLAGGLWQASKRVYVGRVEHFPRGGSPVRVTGSEPAAVLSPGPRGHALSCWLVNLDPSDSRPSGSGGADGLVALADYCTHLGCTVPWRESFRFDGTTGWFRCPCHGVTFTRAGARVFGPSARGMDYYPVTIGADGRVFVDSTRISYADDRGPARATPLPPNLRPTA